MKVLIEETQEAAKAILQINQTHLNDPKGLKSLPVYIWYWSTVLESPETPESPESPGSDEVLIQFQKVANPDVNNDDHWTDALITLSSVKRYELIQAPVTIRVVKSFTENSLGVGCS
jgi:hypothetical protein